MDHDGSPNPGSVIGKIMASHPELKPQARELAAEVKDICTALGKMTPDEQAEKFSKIYGNPDDYRSTKRERNEGLPDLPGAEDGKVVMRFAPGPSGPLHLGHSRAAILNDEYVKRYNGKFILRVEDTNPDKIDPEVYDTLRPDLEWLGVTIHEQYIQSDRFDIYLKYARELLETGNAYICTCDVEDWRDKKNRGAACVHRDRAIEDNLEAWDKMLDGTYPPGSASYVVKTDLNHPNPAVRDFVAMRIVDSPHPRTGTRYRVYPLYNFSVAVDDHLMGMTHVLRGKDHLNNTLRQEYIYKYMGWKKPWFKHYGWVSIDGTVLKKSLITEGIQRGEYTGWDDVRLGTFRALKARGIQPDAIRKYWVEVGLKDVDVKFSWQNLYAYNKNIVDKDARRFFFVWDPVPVTVETDSPIEVNAPLYPDDRGRGSRKYTLKPKDGAVDVVCAADDIKDLKEGTIVRLKNMCNIEITEINKDAIKSRFAGNDLSIIKNGVKIIHYSPQDGALPTTVVMPDGQTRSGLSEPLLRGVTGVVQFERFGFVNIVESNKVVKANFAHK